MSSSQMQDPRALALKADFDRGFAEPPPSRQGATHAYLAVTLEGDPFALRAGEIRGLSADRRLAPAPGETPGFLGLAGLRGRLCPAWDLAALLGDPASEMKLRWLAVAAGEPVWAAAFSRFEGYLELPEGALRPYSGQGASAPFSKAALSLEGGLRPILELSLIRQAIQSRIPTTPRRRTR
jgi:chemotaxis signal transduction protein